MTAALFAPHRATFVTLPKQATFVRASECPQRKEMCWAPANVRAKGCSPTEPCTETAGGPLGAPARPARGEALLLALTKSPSAEVITERMKVVPRSPGGAARTHLGGRGDRANEVTSPNEWQMSKKTSPLFDSASPPRYPFHWFLASLPRAMQTCHVAGRRGGGTRTVGHLGSAARAERAGEGPHGVHGLLAGCLAPFGARCRQGVLSGAPKRVRFFVLPTRNETILRRANS